MQSDVGCPLQCHLGNLYHRLRAFTRIPETRLFCRSAVFCQMGTGRENGVSWEQKPTCQASVCIHRRCPQPPAPFLETQQLLNGLVAFNWLKSNRISLEDMQVCADPGTSQDLSASKLSLWLFSFITFLAGPP